MARKLSKETRTAAIKALREELPAVFGRTAIEKLIPGTYTEKTLANMATKGIGPPCFKQGRKVMYERESFMDWFEAYTAYDHSPPIPGEK